MHMPARTPFSSLLKCLVAIKYSSIGYGFNSLWQCVHLLGFPLVIGMYGLRVLSTFIMEFCKRVCTYKPAYEIIKFCY